MELMARYPDNYFDLAIVDPPYGIGVINNKSIGGIRKGINPKWKNESVREFKIKDWDNEIPNKEYFTELKRVSKNQIIWGGNYFTEFLKPTNSWIFWYKEPNGENLTFSDGELAWTSLQKQLKQVSIPWIGFGSVNLKEKKEHPTQKPAKLYKWILDKYAKQGDKILDTHLGSGSIAIACHDYGFDLTACELDKEYFDKAMERIKNHVAQQKLF
jgi:site-specific DNA-methyltransferase (adenine-specific)